LIDEYETIVREAGESPTDEQLVVKLVLDGDWTDMGAATIVSLAREYGTAILRNALALAYAMGIEDGESGL
jgi:hypothetical protein